jgi:hypothetical protein
VLLQAEIAPVTSAIVPSSVAGVASLASSAAKSGSPPVFSSSATSVDTPHTMMIALHGTRRSVACSSPSRAAMSSAAAAQALGPSGQRQTSSPATQAAIAISVSHATRRQRR